MQAKWMKPSNVLLVTLVAGSFALADTDTVAEAPAWDLGDPHLTIIPRTSADTARISAVPALATDFTSPHRL